MGRDSLEVDLLRNRIYANGDYRDVQPKVAEAAFFLAGRDGFTLTDELVRALHGKSQSLKRSVDSRRATYITMHMLRKVGDELGLELTCIKRVGYRLTNAAS